MRLAALSVLFLFAIAAYASETPALDRKNMDPAVKPSVDFYQYTNGAWLKNTPIPPDYSEWGSFEELVERNYQILHQILEDSAADVKSGKAQTGSVRALVGQYYASGMDAEQINAQGAKPLQPELDAIDKIADSKAIAPYLAHLRSLGIGALFGFTGDIDQKDSTNQIGIASQGGLGLPDRDYYLKDDDQSKKIRDQYVEHITKTFQLLGDPEQAAAAEAKQILAFETELAKASKSRVDLRVPEKNYHKMLIADLEKLASGFDWSAYFNGLNLSKEQVAKIDVEQPEFFKRVAQLVASTPLPTWKAYLRWNLIGATASDLSDPFVDEAFRFRQILTGQKENQPRWKRVLQAVDTGAGEALGQLYVEKNFPPEAKQRALAMVNDLKQSLRERIEKLDWMGPATRAAALKKLDAFGVKIGYPDKWRDYSSLEIKAQPYVLNDLAASVFEAKRQFPKICKPVDKTEWGMSPPTVNAEYTPQRNEISFPAGILQPPFFDATADDAVNYGGIGAVIGHEMTHGFDDEGRKYDRVGNLIDWWSPQSAEEFKKRSGAIVAQYSEYEPLPGLHVNGELTQGENIADIGGVKLAYAALQKALDKNPEARGKKIDGLTPEQRFFLSFAAIWRSKIRDEDQKLRLNTDPHSPADFRVNGPLSDLPEFQKAFNVPDGAPMVRAADKRVNIW